VRRPDRPHPQRKELTMNRLLKHVAAFGLSLIALCAASSLPAAAHGDLPHVPGKPYAPTGLPDRIVLTPGADPSREMAVAFRTDARQPIGQAELAPAGGGPNLSARATLLSGVTAGLDTEYGPAKFHQIRFTGLTPDTAYVYRVKGAEGWSEWFQFRTASAGFKPFRFLYFGDLQNGILSVGSRTIRQGLLATGAPALVVHAGDLVDQREVMVHDDEWGEWTDAGGFAYGMLPQIVAAGNHEYVDAVGPDGQETRVLSPHWPLQFALPANGAAAVPRTSYRVDYQGVRFIVLDGTAALDLGALDSQTEWLKAQLTGNTALWTIVVMHQPIYTCARPDDTELLKTAWKPVFELGRVDLVLQGHDHCYSRLSNPDGREAAARAHANGEPQGPVYVVSVAGQKMYGLNDRALIQTDIAGEDSQLYQVIEIEETRLGFQAVTADGELYDAFSLVRGRDGRSRLVESGLARQPERVCRDGKGPDGTPCTARGK
jgi:3',5'-cyclic AMP phosphodiesterase CpdA